MKRPIHAAGETGPVCGPGVVFTFPRDIAITADQVVTCQECLERLGEQVVSVDTILDAVARGHWQLSRRERRLGTLIYMSAQTLRFLYDAQMRHLARSLRAASQTVDVPFKLEGNTLFGRPVVVDDTISFGDVRVEGTR